MNYGDLRKAQNAILLARNQVSMAKNSILDSVVALESLSKQLDDEQHRKAIQSVSERLVEIHTMLEGVEES